MYYTGKFIDVFHLHIVKKAHKKTEHVHTKHHALHMNNKSPDCNFITCGYASIQTYKAYMGAIPSPKIGENSLPEILQDLIKH